jgi:hypothetical protein
MCARRRALKQTNTEGLKRQENSGNRDETRPDTLEMRQEQNKIEDNPIAKID